MHHNKLPFCGAVFQCSCHPFKLRFSKTFTIYIVGVEHDKECVCIIEGIVVFIGFAALIDIGCDTIGLSIIEEFIKGLGFTFMIARCREQRGVCVGGEHGIQRILPLIIIFAVVNHIAAADDKIIIFGLV